jgi:hypothetical protein
MAAIAPRLAPNNRLARAAKIPAMMAMLNPQIRK